MRFLRFLFIAFASLVALVVAIYLVVNVVGVLAAHAERDALSDQITQRLDEELTASQQRADAVAERAGVEPAHSWAAQHCAFATTESGWMVQDYREVCSLESVNAWQVDTATEAVAMVGEQLPADADPIVSGPCHTYTVAGDSYGDDLTVLYIEPSDQGDRWCEPTDRYDQRRPVVGEVPELDDTQGWLVVVDTKRLVDETIGCAHWSVLFCDNPFGDELAWGEPPA